MPHVETSHHNIYLGQEIVSGERCLIFRLLLLTSIRKILEISISLVVMNLNFFPFLFASNLSSLVKSLKSQRHKLPQPMRKSSTTHPHWPSLEWIVIGVHQIPRHGMWYSYSLIRILLLTQVFRRVALLQSEHLVGKKNL